MYTQQHQPLLSAQRIQFVAFHSSAVVWFTDGTTVAATNSDSYTRVLPHVLPRSGAILWSKESNMGRLLLFPKPILRPARPDTWFYVKFLVPTLPQQPDGEFIGYRDQ